MTTLDQERSLNPLPPKIVGAARIVPIGLIQRLGGQRRETPNIFSRDTAEVERRAVRAVLSAERKLGHRARDMNDEQRNHPGYDIETFAPSEADSSDALHFIEVKGRISGSTTVTVSRNEILTGLNSPDQFILALVDVSFDGSQHDKVRYLRRPFEGIGDTHFAETSRTISWPKLWNLAVEPSAAYERNA